MMIVLICDQSSAGLAEPLSRLGKVEKFFNQFELWEYLLTDQPCDLVISAADGALGMNVCMAATIRKGVPILWITDQKEFEPQSKRIPVDAFLVKPVEPSEVLAVAKRLLNQHPEELPPASPAAAEKSTPLPSHADPPPLPPPKKKWNEWFGSLFEKEKRNQ